MASYRLLFDAELPPLIVGDKVHVEGTAVVCKVEAEVIDVTGFEVPRTRRYTLGATKVDLRGVEMEVEVE